MRRSVMGIGALVAIAVAGSANAFTWHIGGATGASGIPLAVGGSTFEMRAPVNNYFAANFGPGGNPQGAANLNQLQASNVLTNLGVTLAADTMTYFSWVDDAGRGYMAAAYRNSKGSAFTTQLSGLSIVSGSQGLFSTNAFASVSSFSSNAAVTIDSGRTFLMVMGGYLTGSPQIQLAFGGASEGYGIEYLSRVNGSAAWSVIASGTATTTAGSAMNVAAYTIPVPAPMLLAAAGLGGAVALRRRVAR
jgi:hypothetical protein